MDFILRTAIINPNSLNIITQLNKITRYNKLGCNVIKITPAIKKCLELGWNVKGPLAADALFYSASKGGVDLIIAMYHDQGHGPVKVLGIEHGVNVTIGLPIIRTSVDHGTAFDIAGKGIADETNLLNAIKKAVLLIDKVT